MKKSFMFLLCVVLVLASAGLVQAANNASKQAAIQNGLGWLATQQQANGSWNYGNDGVRAATGAALLAFVEQRTKPGGWGGVDYMPVVNKAANYLLSQTRTLALNPITGKPEYNGFYGDKVGVFWASNASPTNGRITYETGLVMPALTRYAQSIAGLDTKVTVPVFANPISYKELLQRATDSFIWGQSWSGGAKGGWRYYPGYNQSDNSTAQWPVVGMLYTTALAGSVVPQSTRDALKVWNGYIQNANGGSGYDSPTNTVNEAKTGGLLIEMVFAGGGGNKNKALEYLNTNWKDPASGWDGNFGHPYAMWSIYKGLEATIGLEDTSIISNLHVDPGNLDPGQKWGWWEDYCESLVNSQNANGSWNGYSEWYGAMATAWNINILNATKIPEPTPIPGSVLLLGSGLLGLMALRRQKKK